MFFRMRHQKQSEIALILKADMSLTSAGLSWVKSGKLLPWRGSFISAVLRCTLIGTEERFTSMDFFK